MSSSKDCASFISYHRLVWRNRKNHWFNDLFDSALPARCIGYTPEYSTSRPIIPFQMLPRRSSLSGQSCWLNLAIRILELFIDKVAAFCSDRLYDFSVAACCHMAHAERLASDHSSVSVRSDRLFIFRNRPFLIYRISFTTMPSGVQTKHFNCAAPVSRRLNFPLQNSFPVIGPLRETPSALLFTSSDQHHLPTE